eukprot:scaffold478945_cov17-Prasinocladus_malaysianus.AAC.1
MMSGPCRSRPPAGKVRDPTRIHKFSSLCSLNWNRASELGYIPKIVPNKTSRNAINPFHASL